jgi:hypothetical protein
MSLCEADGNKQYVTAAPNYGTNSLDANGNPTDPVEPVTRSWQYVYCHPDGSKGPISKMGWNHVNDFTTNTRLNRYGYGSQATNLKVPGQTNIPYHHIRSMWIPPHVIVEVSSRPDHASTDKQQRHGILYYNHPDGKKRSRSHVDLKGDRTFYFGSHGYYPRLDYVYKSDYLKEAGIRVNGYNGSVLAERKNFNIPTHTDIQSIVVHRLKPYLQHYLECLYGIVTHTASAQSCGNLWDLASTTVGMQNIANKTYEKFCMIEEAGKRIIRYECYGPAIKYTENIIQECDTEITPVFNKLKELETIILRHHSTISKAQILDLSAVADLRSITIVNYTPQLEESKTINTQRSTEMTKVSTPYIKAKTHVELFTSLHGERMNAKPILGGKRIWHPFRVGQDTAVEPNSESLRAQTHPVFRDMWGVRAKPEILTNLQQKFITLENKYTSCRNISDNIIRLQAEILAKNNNYLLYVASVNTAIKKEAEAQKQARIDEANRLAAEKERIAAEAAEALRKAQEAIDIEAERRRKQDAADAAARELEQQLELARQQAIIDEKNRQIEEDARLAALELQRQQKEQEERLAREAELHAQELERQKQEALAEAERIKKEILAVLKNLIPDAVSSNTDFVQSSRTLQTTLYNLNERLKTQQEIVNKTHQEYQAKSQEIRAEYDRKMLELETFYKQKYDDMLKFTGRTSDFRADPEYNFQQQLAYDSRDMSIFANHIDIMIVSSQLENLQNAINYLNTVKVEGMLNPLANEWPGKVSNPRLLADLIKLETTKNLSWYFYELYLYLCLEYSTAVKVVNEEMYLKFLNDMFAKYEEETVPLALITTNSKIHSIKSSLAKRANEVTAEMRSMELLLFVGNVEPNANLQSSFLIKQKEAADIIRQAEVEFNANIEKLRIEQQKAHDEFIAKNELQHQEYLNELQKEKDRLAEELEQKKREAEEALLAEEARILAERNAIEKAKIEAYNEELAKIEDKLETKYQDLNEQIDTNLEESEKLEEKIISTTDKLIDNVVAIGENRKEEIKLDETKVIEEIQEVSAEAAAKGDLDQATSEKLGDLLEKQATIQVVYEEVGFDILKAKEELKAQAEREAEAQKKETEKLRITTGKASGQLFGVVTIDGVEAYKELYNDKGELLVADSDGKYTLPVYFDKEKTKLYDGVKVYDDLGIRAHPVSLTINASSNDKILGLEPLLFWILLVAFVVLLTSGAYMLFRKNKSYEVENEYPDDGEELPED